MKLVTVATHSERYFPYLLESCKRVGAKLDILGWQQPWRGFMMKYDLLKEYLSNITDDEIVCVIDAYDVILLEPLNKLEAVFRETGTRIAVALDCNPNVFYAQYIFGKCKGFLINAGTYIGYAGDLRKMVLEICNMHNCKDKKLDDQMILTSYCNTTDIHIDRKREMFFLICFFNGIPDIVDGKIMYNGLKPCILHAPANTNIDNVLTKLGYDVKGVDHKFWQYWLNMAVRHWYVTVFYVIIFFVIIVVLWRIKRSKNSPVKYRK